MSKFYKRKDWSGEEYYIDEKTKKEEDEAAAGCLQELGLWTPFLTLLYCFFSSFFAQELYDDFYCFLSSGFAQQIFDDFNWIQFVVLIVINCIYYFCLSEGSFKYLPKFELFLSLIAVGYFVYLFYDYEWSIPVKIIIPAISVILLICFFIRNR